MTGPGARDAGQDEHDAPVDIDEAIVDALGKLSEALEKTERARGRLYDFHQLTGAADFALDDVVAAFRAAGQDAAADRVERELVGRNVLPGMWTFQIVEAYDDGYFRAFRDLERDLREELAQGRRHGYEARLKEQRQSGKSYGDA